MTQTNSVRYPLVWILCLAAIAVGARNFEPSITLDAPVYATIARNIARSGEWFRMNANIPHFVPFTEHPHLGFWLVALVFRVLPAEDWAARIVGHFFYVSFLLMFFLYIRKKADEKVAVLTVLFLWSWHYFSNICSTVYLDPGTLFFGVASIICLESALQRDNNKFAIISGICIALAFMYKGLTALGFLPGLAAVAILNLGERKTWPRRLMQLGYAAASAILVLGIYVELVLHSHVPDFFQLYWSRQMSHRFERIWDWSRLVDYRFWKGPLVYTYWLSPLCFLAFVSKKRWKRLAWPTVLSISFVLMFAPAGLHGGQYLILILPWIAWFLAEGLSPFIPLKSTQMAKASMVLALTAVILIQYLPFRTHSGEPLPEKVAVRTLKNRYSLTKLFLASPDAFTDHVASGSFAWYTDLEVVPVKGLAIPLADHKSVMVSSFPISSDLTKDKRWCFFRRYERHFIWLECENPEFRSGPDGLTRNG